ncbi:MAG TPA: prepilin peptidase [Candidatus Paceibacterota bacterium]
MIPTGLILFIVFLFGVVIGSFLNVVILRLRTGVGVQGRSMCMSCGTELHWLELIPVLSFVFQGGRCTGCKARISWQYPIVEVVTGILYVIVLSRLLDAGLTVSHIVTTLIYLGAVSLFVVITAYDLRHKIIPDGLVYAFDVLALVSVFVGGMGGSAPLLHAPHVWTLLAGPVLALPFALLWLVSKGTWIGLGDAKLILGIGWLLGMSGGVNALVLSFWSGAVVSIVWLLVMKHGIKRKTEIPFGPFLILGTLIVLFWGITVLDIRLLGILFQ